MQRQLLVLALVSIASAALAQEAPHQHQHEVQGHEHASANEMAFGRAGDPAKVDRTIVVEARDPVEFVPSRIDVKAGETIRFVVRNVGKHDHEMVLGTMKELEEHHEEMKGHPQAMHHDAPHMVALAPGKSGTIVWQFTKPG